MSTICGSSIAGCSSGSDDDHSVGAKAGLAVKLKEPARGCVDPFGNFVFADQGNSIILRASPGGHVQVIGGRAEKSQRVDGDNAHARFYCMP